jgi:PAS domain S-box-containing protein
VIPPAPPQHPLAIPAPKTRSGRPPAHLAEEVRRIRELFDQAPGCMIVFTGPDHVIQMANPAHLAFTGLGPDIVGQPARLAMSRGYSRGFGRLLDAVYATGKPKVQKATKLLVTRHPGGPDEEAYGDFVLQPLRDAQGVVYGVFCQGHEVTVEKLAADELRASREQLKAALDSARAIFDNSHDVICEFGPDGVFRQVNQHAERMWGYRPDEMIGRSFTDFTHPDDIGMTAEIGRQVAAGLPTKTFMNRYLHKDGTVVPVMWSSVRSEAQGSLISIGRDMRDHIAAEEKLRQAQKMEAIGRLTGGIAHDFNNLLTVVIGSTEALADALAVQPELASIARLALDAAERGAELVSRLLAFARTQPLAPQAVDCNKFLDALAPILRRTISSDIKIKVEAPDGELRCVADLTQLTSAVLNLCINARDSMPGGGRLTIRATRQGKLGGEEPAFIVLSIQDTGEGMSQQIRARALEPFFTTKPEGQGSGLGLSMVHGFVSQSGGRMEIESEPGRGSCVRLYLPQTAKIGESTVAEPSAVVSMQGRRVLLVEDDDLLRDQVERQLTLLGCRVTAEGNGHDALRRLEAGCDVELLMTDIAMPGGMNGRQLADHARRLNPDLRILFTSGHTDDAAILTLRMDGQAGFLGKPYRRAALARKLAEVFQDQPVRAICD